MRRNLGNKEESCLIHAEGFQWVDCQVDREVKVDSLTWRMVDLMHASHIAAAAKSDPFLLVLHDAV